MSNIIQTKRIKISEHNRDDLNDMHSLLSDDEAMYYLPEIKTNCIEESKDNLETALKEKSKSDRTKYYYKITTLEDVYIGEIGFTVIVDSPKGKIVNLGYFIKKEYWNRGIVTEAVKELITYSFNSLNIVKIETGCLKENTKSEKIMKKVGMKKESELRMHVFHHNEYKDRVEYGLLKSEWMGNKETKDF